MEYSPDVVWTADLLNLFQDALGVRTTNSDRFLANIHELSVFFFVFFPEEADVMFAGYILKGSFNADHFMLICV